MKEKTELYEIDTSSSDAPLLQVNDLHVEFATREGVARAVNGVSFMVEAGKTLAVLGESGSGKSVTAQAIMGIVDSPPGSVTGGTVLLHGVDILKLSDEERRLIRGERIAMIFQDALSSLNPTFTVGWQISELFRVRRDMGKKEAQARALELMERVSIPGTKERFHNYPHEFSGGMRQRVMIAMALACKPKLLIADEPTTALDVTIQAQILDLLSGLVARDGMSLVFITHDLAVLSQVATHAVVLDEGRVIEHGPLSRLLTAPASPITQGLLRDATATLWKPGGLA